LKRSKICAIPRKSQTGAERYWRRFAEYETK
jgi:hypothetical protein